MPKMLQLMISADAVSSRPRKKPQRQPVQPEVERGDDDRDDGRARGPGDGALALLPRLALDLADEAVALLRRRSTSTAALQIVP